ncbi:MAG: alpha/beta fold hydrolase [Verrucomicrobiota bacterium]
MKLLLIALFFLGVTNLTNAKSVSLAVDGGTLHGTLQEANSPKNSLVVFILAGSGPTDRDGNTIGAPGKNNSLKRLAEQLNSHGISSLRTDKRGIGESASAMVSEVDLRFDTYVNDMKAWLQFLNDHDHDRVILLGHSEGALIASQLAQKHPKQVIGMISLAGAGKPAPTILRDQLKPKLPEDLYTQADMIIEKLSQGQLVESPPSYLQALFRPSVQPYLISWFALDPAEEYSKIDQPLLILQGSTDIQTTVDDAQLLHQRNPRSKLHVINGMNHVLKAVEGSLEQQTPSYFDPSLPLHKELIPQILAFIDTLNTNVTSAKN